MVMPKTYKITHEDVLEAQKYMNETKDLNAYRRLQVIELRGQGLSREEVALITHFSKSHVSQIVTKFIHKGMPSLLEDKRTGNNRKVTEWQEKKFLKSWKRKAERGEVVEIKMMLEAFQEKFDVEMSVSGFYDLLKRHGWRKIKPRPKHPKAASQKEVKRSKKLSVAPGI